MIRFICILILLVSFVRYSFGSKSQYNLNRLLLSATIQSLMMYGVLYGGMALDEVARQELDFGAPIESNVGLLLPTLVAFIVLVTNKVRVHWITVNDKYAIFAIGIAFLYSYLTPYNASIKATNIGLIVILQIFFAVKVFKECIDKEQFVWAFFDAFKIITIVESLVVVSFLFFHITTFQYLFVNGLEFDAFVREGTNTARAFGTFYQPNRLGGFMAFIVLFYTICYYADYNKSKSLIYLVLAAIVLLLSQSRSSIVATAISLVLLYLFNLRKEGRLSIGKLIALSLVAVISFSLVSQIPFIQQLFFESDSDEMALARLGHYEIAGMIIQDTYGAGVGINAHTHYMYYRMGIGEWLSMHPIHCIHLVVLVETGILGLLCWIYYIISRIRRFFKVTYVDEYDMITWSVFIGMLVIIVVHGFSDIVYIHYQLALIFALFASFAPFYEYNKNTH